MRVRCRRALLCLIYVCVGFFKKKLYFLFLYGVLEPGAVKCPCAFLTVEPKRLKCTWLSVSREEEVNATPQEVRCTLTGDYSLILHGRTSNLGVSCKILPRRLWSSLWSVARQTKKAVEDGEALVL